MASWTLMTRSRSLFSTGTRRAEPGARCDLRRSDLAKPTFGERPDPAVPTRIEIAFGSFRLLPAKFLLLEGDKPVHLGSRALGILGVLLEQPSELVSNQELMTRVWPNVNVQPANLTVHVSALRRVLRDGCDGNRFIVNVPGRGYSFVASVEVSQHMGRAPRAGHRCPYYRNSP
jgi:DNA-binding winged helix-turn-helix (wHTH) protein